MEASLMSRISLVLTISVLAVALAFPAYAAVQNVKVSGDMKVRTFIRNDYDLDKNDTSGNTSVSTPGNNNEEYFMHSLGVNIATDLTDKVGVMTRIINQRDWDSNSSGANTFDADIDLAYVTLKEFFFAPLTVSIGRQDLWYGRGFIVGAKLMDFNGTINANEYTETAAFDAIKATIDLNPWVLYLAYAKVDENVISANDDVDLYIANLGRRFGFNNAEMETYAISKIDNGPQLQGFPTSATSSTVRENTVHTFGIRGSMDVPGNVLTETNIAGELAHQTGNYNELLGTDRSRDAWAVDLSAEKRFSNVTWKPKLGLEYIRYSGENSYAPTDTGTWNAWDPVYRGKYDTAIREFQNYYYATAFRAANVGTAVANTGTEVDMDSGLTNEKQLLLSGTIYPFKKVTVKGVLAQFWLDEDLRANDSTGVERSQKRSNDLGRELDLLLTYDYSNDVSFSLLWGTFFPGKYWMAGQNDTASDLVGSVTLTF
jgi:hypothetical protein